MTAAQIKKELKAMGFRAVTEKVPGIGGGCEYILYPIGSDESVAEGWSAGNTADALESAYEDALRLKRGAA